MSTTNLLYCGHKFCQKFLACTALGLCMMSLPQAAFAGEDPNAVADPVVLGTVDGRTGAVIYTTPAEQSTQFYAPENDTSPYTSHPESTRTTADDPTAVAPAMSTGTVGEPRY